jgi:hypothetical protein
MSFVPKQDQSYVLEVSMDSEPALLNDEVQVWMRCGGYR